MAQKVKHLPAVRQTQVQSLGREDPLEKEMATHSSTLAWKISWTEEPGRLQSMGSQRVRHDGVTSLSLFFFLFKNIRTQLYAFLSPAVLYKEKKLFKKSEVNSKVKLQRSGFNM